MKKIIEKKGNKTPALNDIREERTLADVKLRATVQDLSPMQTLIKCPRTSATIISGIATILIVLLKEKHCGTSDFGRVVAEAVIGITKHKKLNSESMYGLLQNMSYEEGYVNIAHHANLKSECALYLLRKALSPKAGNIVLQRPLISYAALVEFVKEQPSHDHSHLEAILENPNIDGAMIQEIYLKQNLEGSYSKDIINSIAMKSLTPLPIIKEIFQTDEHDWELLRNPVLPEYMRRVIENTDTAVEDARKLIIELCEELEEIKGARK